MRIPKYLKVTYFHKLIVNLFDLLIYLRVYIFAILFSFAEIAEIKNMSVKLEYMD